MRRRERQELGRAKGRADVAAGRIMGDWDDVSMHAGFFTFDMEGPELRARYEPLFAKFKKLCEEAVLTSTPKETSA